MAPVLRSQDKPVFRAFHAESPKESMHDDGHFDGDVLLAEQPIIGEPGILTFIYHPYITIRVGPELAVYYVNAEKWSKKSAHGKHLCSRISTIYKHKKYRVDYPEEEESTLSYLLDYINHDSYQPHTDSFRGSFLCHLKLYELALKYEVPGLAKLVLAVVADMLTESHPEQMTRACFWSAVVDQVFKATLAGDPLRDIISGFPLWYSKQGRGRHYQIRSGSVENTLLLLGDLKGASPFYRISFTLFAENPEYLEDKLHDYLGEGRRVDGSLTRMWRDAVEDSLFQGWMDHWKMAERAERIHSMLVGVNENYSDSLKALQLADDEDEVVYGEKRVKQKGTRKEKRRGKKEAKKISSKNRSIKRINRMRDQKNSGVSTNNELAGSNARGEGMSIEVENHSSAEIDPIDVNRISLDEVGGDGGDTIMTAVDIQGMDKENEVALALVELAQGQINTHEYRTTRSGRSFVTQLDVYHRFGLDGTSDRANDLLSGPNQNSEATTFQESVQFTPSVLDVGKQACRGEDPFASQNMVNDITTKTLIMAPGSFAQAYGMRSEISEPILGIPEAGAMVPQSILPENHCLGLLAPTLPPMQVTLPPINQVFSWLDVPGRKFDARVLKTHDRSGHSIANTDTCNTTDEAEESTQFEGLGTQGWVMRNVPRDTTGWVVHLEAMAETMAEIIDDSGVEDMGSISGYSDKSAIIEAYWMAEAGCYNNSADVKMNSGYESIEDRGLWGFPNDNYHEYSTCVEVDVGYEEPGIGDWNLKVLEDNYCSYNTTGVEADIGYHESSIGDWYVTRTPGGTYRGYNTAGIEVDIEYEGPRIGDWKLKVPESYYYNYNATGVEMDNGYEGLDIEDWNMRRTPGGTYRGYNAAGIELDIEYEGPGVGDWKLKSPGDQYHKYNHDSTGMDTRYEESSIGGWDLEGVPENNCYNFGGYEKPSFQEWAPETLEDKYHYGVCPYQHNFPYEPVNQVLEPLYFQHDLNGYGDETPSGEPNSQVWAFNHTSYNNTNTYGNDLQYNEEPLCAELPARDTAWYTAGSLYRFNNHAQVMSDGDLGKVTQNRRYKSRFGWVNEAWAEEKQYSMNRCSEASWKMGG